MSSYRVHFERRHRLSLRRGSATFFLLIAFWKKIQLCDETAGRNGANCTLWEPQAHEDTIGRWHMAQGYWKWFKDALRCLVWLGHSDTTQAWPLTYLAEPWLIR